MSHTIAIVGRPNVGKSTLFNRLLGRKHAIVDNQSGVTRDRQYGTVIWGGQSFNVIDTGGFVPNSEDVFEAAIREQVEIAMDESSVILFMVDVSTGMTDLDEEMLRMLRRSSKKVITLVNKVDNPQRQIDATEFYSLGMDPTFFLSSMSGTGTGEVLDAIVEFLPTEEEQEEEEVPRFAIIGQPNVGKSTLLNALTGQQRNIVTDIAGTTRDAIHTRYRLFDKDFLLIDTAGLRKKAKVNENLEFYSVIRAVKAIDEADVCLLLMDASMGVEGQDISIFSLAARKRKGVVILVNKWDMVEKETNTHLDFEKRIRERIAPFTDVPIVFISATQKQRIFKAMETALEVYANRTKKIKTSELNNFIQEAIEKHRPPSVRGRFVKIKYITQLPTHAPTFAFFCNHPRDIKEPYRNYLENQIRSKWDFCGVPISLVFRQK